MMLKRLHTLKNQDLDEKKSQFQRPFANIGNSLSLQKKRTSTVAQASRSTNDVTDKASENKKSNQAAGSTTEGATNTGNKPNEMNGKRQRGEEGGDSEEEKTPAKKAARGSETAVKEPSSGEAKEKDAPEQSLPAKEKFAPPTSVCQMAHKIHKDQPAESRTSRLLSPRKETSGIAQCGGKSYSSKLNNFTNSSLA